MFAACFACYSQTVNVWRSIFIPVWRWITTTWRRCVAAPCNWWCLCCNKWFCWIVLILIAVLVFIVVVILEVIVVVVCVVINAWCLLCTLICWLGCFGNPRCVSNCSGPCTTFTSPPIGVGGGPGTTTGGLTAGSPPGTGTTTGTGTPTDASPYAGLAPALGTETFSDLSALEQAIRQNGIFPPSNAIRVDLPDTDTRRSQVLQAAIDRYSRACGCREGKVGLLGALLLFVALMWARPAMLDLHGWAIVAVGFTLVCCGAVLGKVLGLWRARAELLNSIMYLQQL